LGNLSLAWILNHQYFQADKYWYIIRIIANPMNRNAQINIAQIIHQATSAKSEKRRHFRLSLHLPMEYSFRESSRLRLAYTVDICEGGLLMYTPEKLEIGQNLRVKFYYDSAAGMDCIQALGEVIRVDRLGKSGKEYSCAVRFSDLPPDFLEKLRKFLKSLY
jgi:c-di-GMP-binding flagellar brake protein YcgR